MCAATPFRSANGTGEKFTWKPRLRLEGRAWGVMSRAVGRHAERNLWPFWSKDSVFTSLSLAASTATVIKREVRVFFIMGEHRIYVQLFYLWFIVA